MGRKLHYRTTRFHGLPISIENRKGSIRHWTDSKGRRGKTKMLMPYGYVRGVMGADGDQLDVYLGPNRLSRTVYVVNQRAAHLDARHFDEHKVLLGFDSEKEARDAFLDHYDNPKFLGSMTTMTIERFKQWISDGKKKTRPVYKGRVHDFEHMGALVKGTFIGPKGGQYEDAALTRPKGKGGHCKRCGGTGKVVYKQHVIGGGIERKAAVCQACKGKRTKTGTQQLHLFKAAGPFIGPRGGKWADPQHKIPWRESIGRKGPRTGTMAVPEATVRAAVDDLMTKTALKMGIVPGKAPATVYARWKTQVQVTDPTGHKHEITVRAEPSERAKQSPKKITGAFTSELTRVHDDGPHGRADYGARNQRLKHEIVLRLAPETWGTSGSKGTARTKLAAAMRDVLSHELAHLMDPGIRKQHERIEQRVNAGKEVEAHQPRGKSEAEYRAYLNKPTEVTASIQQIRRDLTDKKVVAELLEDQRLHAEDPDYPSPDRPETLLHFSDRWQLVGEHYTEKNKRRVLRAVFDIRESILEGTTKKIEKSGAHKYLSKKRGADGKWVYQYALQPHARTFGRKEEKARTLHVQERDDGDLRVSEHENVGYGTTMPKESLKHFINDLQGKVDVPKGSGNPNVEQVIEGKAEFLGKGDDGLAFRTGKDGDTVVKVSTTVPFQPMNPGHRSPEQAKQMIRAQVVIGNALADKVPGIQRSTFLAHGDKGFQIKSYVEIPERWTRSQLDTAQKTLIAMHKQGYSLNDEVQIGIDVKSGKVVMYDVGKAAKMKPGADDPNDIYSAVNNDMDHMKRLYEASGVPFARLDFNKAAQMWQRTLSDAEKKWSKDPKKIPFARNQIKLAAKRMRKDIEARYAEHPETLKEKLKRLDDDVTFANLDLDWAEEDHAKKGPAAPKYGEPGHDVLADEPTKKAFAKAGKVGGKYIKRVPYTDKHGKRKYRYYYRESSVARDVQAGETVKLGKKFAEILDVGEDGSIQMRIGGEDKVVKPDEWHRMVARAYGAKYHAWAEKRASQTINSVLRLVPRHHLEDLQGDTDAERFEDLKKRLPSVYRQLQKSFQRAGINPMRAKQILSRTLDQRGWEPEARALVVGQVLKYRKTPFRQLIRAAENLAGGDKVSAGHVATVLELRPPGREEQFATEIVKLAKKAEQELAALSEALSKAKGGEGGAELLSAALGADALQKLQMLTRAFPGLREPVAEQGRKALLEVPAHSPRQHTSTEGSETSVYVAGEGGEPKALQARYRLVEASEVIASHDPSSFKRRGDYPEDVQERAYHRDKTEQAKVIRNAQKLNPAFVVNTNPDAVNGPPMITADGIALGGNSRTMSMQRAYAQHPDKAEQLKSYLADHAHEVGLTADDVHAMKNPILVREVQVEDKSKQGLQLLVRQMNESFTQGMDPRTLQVAMGRKLSDDAVGSLANAMEEGETLNAFLSSKRAEPFINQLMRAGIIDQRNANQYMRKGTKQLNNDGKQLVARILVGRTVGDADILSDTGTQMVNAIAQAVPAMTQATAYGKGYDVGEDLAVAVDAFNDLHRRVESGVIPALDPKMNEQRFKGLFNYFDSLFGDKHPVVDNPRARQLFEVLIRKRGPVQLTAVFRDYAKRASQHPEGQGSMFGPAATPEQVLDDTVKDALGKSLQRYRIHPMSWLRGRRG